MKATLLLLFVLTLVPGVVQAQPKEKAMSPPIENGATVQLEYTLKDDAGTVLDSNKGRPPLSYVQGQQQIVPGLEKALNGMRAGDEKNVVVNPEEGYGLADPTAQTEVPKQVLPADALTVGTQLVARSRTGETMLVRVKEVKDATVIIDLNHPLAGKTLHFDIKVLGVEPANK